MVATMVRLTFYLASCGLLFSFLCPFALAKVSIQTVAVGNPGNPPDTRYIDSRHPNGIGSVAQTFRIAKTEVTNAQYTEFLNAVAGSDPFGLYNTDMGDQSYGGIIRTGPPGSYIYSVKLPEQGGVYPYENKPVVYVNWGDAARFTNWLHNGQPVGPEGASTTEQGAYTLNGATSSFDLAAVTRNAGAQWWIPSEDQWYKAAYHKKDGITGNYWNYPTGTSVTPNNHLPIADTGNSANFLTGNYTTNDRNFPMTDAGAYTTTKSAYGTFDQGGNVFEWIDTLFSVAGNLTTRSFRGGDWGHTVDALLPSYYSLYSPAGEANDIGFRVVTLVNGDMNGDGNVDAMDYVIWRKDSGPQSDYNTWRANFGSTSVAGSVFTSTIPEPTMCSFLAIALVISVFVWPRVWIARHS
jgi:formylglycine-generating enzyme